jgi:hypothetical protein
MSKQDRKHLERFMFSRILLIPIGGFASAVVLLLRALLYAELGFLPETMGTLAIDFKSDPPRVPKFNFLQIAAGHWENVDYKPRERALLNNLRNMHDLQQQIEGTNSELQWLRRSGLYWPGLLEIYKGQEAGRIPRLGAFFAALEAREYRRFARTWLDQLTNNLRDLQPESPKPLEILNQGVRAISLSSEKEITVVPIFGARGGTGHGVSQALALSVRGVAQKLGIDVKIVGATLTGPYRSDDGTERMKDALEYALLKELEDSMTLRAQRSFSVSATETFSHTGPLWDSMYRIDATSYMAHMEEAAMYNAARILRLLLFTRNGYEWRKNFGNDGIRLNVSELAALNA